MGNLLQMSITSGQDTDSRQFTLAANSHRLAGETYDANGNRTSGSADGFTSVSYNILNLPETVTAGGWTINYLYSAAGVKLRERVILSDPPVILSASEESTTDYAGNTVFRDSFLHKVLTGSGYLETTDSLQTLLSHPGYRFFITDHLGSVRAVVDSQGSVVERNDYYTYGKRHTTGRTYADLKNSPLLFSGKEDQGQALDIASGTTTPSDLRILDFGARHYDPIVPRWTTPDPLAEKYFPINPYAYCAGDPVNYWDPEGREIVINGSEKSQKNYLKMLYNSTGILKSVKKIK